MSESRNTLKKEFLDPEYRQAYAEDFLNTLIATQIRVLRDQRELTQEEFGELIGTQQAGVSRLENVNYSSWKTETLRKIARALKVRLKITFEDFTTLLDDAESFSRENLQRVAFEQDPTFQPIQLKKHRHHRTVRITVGSLHISRRGAEWALAGGTGSVQFGFSFERPVGNTPKIIEIPIAGGTRTLQEMTARIGGFYGNQTTSTKEYGASSY